MEVLITCGKHVLPGDVIGILKLDKLKNPFEKVYLGEGLNVKNKEIIVTKCGKLRMKEKNSKRTYYIEHSSQKHYHPRLGDSVIGMIIRFMTDFYIVDIGANKDCLLNKIAFDGATKRNRPYLKKGDIVYGRIISNNKFTDAEITCMTPKGNVKRKDWVYGDNVYGSLKGGYIFEVDLGFSVELMKKDNVALKVIGEYVPFEVVVGLNGKVWVNSQSTKNIVVIVNTIKNSRGLNSDQLSNVVQTLLKKVSSSH